MMKKELNRKGETRHMKQGKKKKGKTIQEYKHRRQSLDLKLKHTRERRGGLGELTFRTLLTPRSQSDFH